MRVVLFGAPDSFSKDLVSTEGQAESQKMLDTYNIIKQVIWNCVRVGEKDETTSSEFVNVDLLIKHM